MTLLPRSVPGWWSLALSLVTALGVVVQLAVADGSGDDSPVLVTAGVVATAALFGAILCAVFALGKRQDRSVLVVAVLVLALVALAWPSG